MMENLRERLIGSWKLVSVQFRLSDPVETIDSHFGPNPRGYCTFDTQNRWTVVVTAFDQPAPAADSDKVRLYDHMVAFTGRYRLAEDTIVVTADVSWNPAIIGTEMRRVVDLQGNRLTLTQPEWDHPLFPGRKTIGLVVWQREN